MRGVSWKLRNKSQKPLTLALSRRERGLTEVFSRATPTWHTAPNVDFEKHEDRLPFPLAPLGAVRRFGRAGVRG
ncbi:hypothetical protein RS3R1_19200 [Pseudomonas atacamensis]|uniref:DUF1534 domain-containing protein n=1 Tax=Pseudomonas atacamensis TaxID=2565368 RepID=A0ABQ5PHE8_9PSED|nr:hypothetical protein RS3R1_19200 [Pseudomonas atacamensis]